MSDVIEEYNILRNWLVKNKIQYAPYKINYKQIHVKVFNIQEDSFYNSLCNLDINGSMYVDL